MAATELRTLPTLTVKLAGSPAAAIRHNVCIRMPLPPVVTEIDVQPAGAVMADELVAASARIIVSPSDVPAGRLTVMVAVSLVAVLVPEDVIAAAAASGQAIRLAAHNAPASTRAPVRRGAANRDMTLCSSAAATATWGPRSPGPPRTSRRRGTRRRRATRRRRRRPAA